MVVDVPEKNFTMGVWIKTDAGDVGIYAVLDGPAGAGGHDRHFFLKDGNINFRTWKGPAWATDILILIGKNVFGLVFPMMLQRITSTESLTELPILLRP